MKVIFLLLPFTLGRLLVTNHESMSSKPVLSQEQAKEAVETSSDYCVVEGVTGYSGFIPVLPDNSSMYYWLTNKLGTDISTDSSPLIMWLDGGPGGSSFNGNLYMIGPLYIDSSFTPVLRETTWATNYHLLFVDNPLGAGYSFVTDEADYSVDEDQVSENVYTMLVGLNEKHPEWFSNRDFYIFGVSYAGKYIPCVASYILQMNAKQGQFPFPLKGIGIGDGLTDPITQFATTADYTFAAGLIDEYEYEIVSQYQQQSIQYIQQENWADAFPAMMNVYEYIQQQAGNVSIYNDRIFSEYVPPYGEEWPSLNSTKTLLNVPLSVPFVYTSWTAFDALLPDMGKSVKYLLPNLLDNIKVLLYNGQDDLIVPTMGAENWINSIEWSGQSQYLASERVVWHIQGEVAGYVQTYGALTQVTVLDAGHGVEHFQPVRGFDMVNRFIQGEAWD